MPPQGADAGLIFLQHVIEYAECVLFPNGCTCGSPADFTIEAEMTTAPGGARVVGFYVIECLACHVRTQVPADVLENFSAASWQATGSTPGSPMPKATCVTCGQEAEAYKMRPFLDGWRCPACVDIDNRLGEITEVTTDEPLL